MAVAIVILALGVAGASNFYSVSAHWSACPRPLALPMPPSLLITYTLPAAHALLSAILQAASPYEAGTTPPTASPTAVGPYGPGSLALPTPAPSSADCPTDFTARIKIESPSCLYAVTVNGEDVGQNLGSSASQVFSYRLRPADTDVVVAVRGLCRASTDACTAFRATVSVCGQEVVTGPEAWACSATPESLDWALEPGFDTHAAGWRVDVVESSACPAPGVGEGKWIWAAEGGPRVGGAASQTYCRLRLPNTCRDCGTPGPTTTPAPTVIAIHPRGTPWPTPAPTPYGTASPTPCITDRRVTVATTSTCDYVAYIAGQAATNGVPAGVVSRLTYEVEGTEDVGVVLIGACTDSQLRGTRKAIIAQVGEPP
jgi:hypothetical protein